MEDLDVNGGYLVDHRLYVASFAMQGLIAAKPNNRDYRRVAQIALNYADALLAEKRLRDGKG